MRYLYLLVSLFIINASLAQKATLKGVITEEDGEPAIQANIVIDASTGLATVTDFDGNYSLSLDPGEYAVLYRYIGKEDQVRKVSVASGETKVVNIVFMEKVELINTIVVSASKYEKKLSEETVSIEVVKSDLLENANINDAEAGLTKVPGVTVADGQANIRGGSGWSYGAGSRVLVLYDDLPLLSAEGGDAKWGLVPMENLETMEVIKGAASSIYGSGALNGVINFRTGFAKKDPETKITMWNGITHGPRNKKEAWWYENNTLPIETGLSFVHKRKFGRVDFVWHGQTKLEKKHLLNGSSSNARFGQKFRFRPKKIEGLSMGVNFNAYRSWGSNFFLWQGPDSLARVPLVGSDTRNQSTRVIIDPFLTYYDGKNNNFRLKFRYFNAKNEAEQGQGSKPINYYGEFQYNRYFQKIKFNMVAGLAGFADVVKPISDEGSLSGDNRRYNLAPYAQFEKKLINEKLNLTVGMRYEFFNTISFTSDTAFNSFSDLKRPLFRFGANYQAAEYTFIRASWGEGYRFPNIAENFVNLDIGGVGIYPNPKLSSEQGWYAEIAAKQGFKIGDGWQGFVDWSVFTMYYDNMIEVNFGQFGTTPTADNLFGLGFSFQNVGETRVTGTEFTVQGTGKIANKFPLTILGGYTYTNPKSLNLDEEITLYNELGVEINPGDVILPGELIGFPDPINASGLLPEASRERLSTYAGTLSSGKNVLKYRNKHVFTVDVQTGYKKVDFGLSIQYRSFMENIDFFFVSPFLTDELEALPLQLLQDAGTLEPGETRFEDIIGTQGFSELRNFRERYKGRGTTLLSARINYNFTENASLSLIGNNLLNLTYSDRPGVLGQPMNFSARFSYKFTGKNREKKSAEE